MAISVEDASKIKSLLEEFKECDKEITSELQCLKTDIKNARIFFNPKKGRNRVNPVNFSILPNITQIENEMECRPKRKAARNADKVMKALVSDNTDVDKMRRPTMASSTAEKLKMAAEGQDEFLHPAMVGNIAKGVKTKQSTRKTNMAEATRVLNDGCNQTYDIPQAGPSSKKTRASSRKKNIKDDESTEDEEVLPKKSRRNTRMTSRIKQSVVKETMIINDDDIPQAGPSSKKTRASSRKKNIKDDESTEDEEVLPKKSRRNTRMTSRSTDNVEIKPKRGRKATRAGNQTKCEESEAVPAKSKKTTLAASRMLQSVVPESDVSTDNDEGKTKRGRKTTRGGNKTYTHPEPQNHENTDTDQPQQPLSNKRKSRSSDKTQIVANTQAELPQPLSSGTSDSESTFKSPKSNKRSRSGGDDTLKSNKRSKSDDRTLKVESGVKRRSQSSSRADGASKEEINTLNLSPPRKEAEQNLGFRSAMKMKTPSKIPLSRSASAKRKQDVEKSEQRKKERELLLKKIKEEEALQKKLKEEAAKKMLKEQEVLRKKEALMNDKKELLRKKNIEKTQVAANKEALEREKREEMERLESEKERKERLKREELERERELQILKKKELQKKKFLEVEERRLKEEATRIAKLKELEEEQKRQAEIASKQKEEAARLLHERKLKEEEEKKRQKAAPKNVLKDVQNNVPYEDYGMDSDIEDERKPKRPIPDWAKGETLAKTVTVQNALYSTDLIDLFFDPPQTMPNVKKLFGRCALVRARTSSACWSKPLNE